MKIKILYILFQIIYAQAIFSQLFDVDTILLNGPIEKRINLVILSDGYTAVEIPQFTLDAQNLTQDIFQTSPMAEYQSYFNVFAINVPSVESGASHPNSASDCPATSSHPAGSVNNYFGSQFDYYGIHRLLVATNTTAISSVLASNFPLYDQVFVLVNTPYYGGSGGWLATSSLHSSASEIAIHEIGHSFTSLADEYYAGDVYAAERPNMTQDTSSQTNKWRNWLGDQSIGVYQHCCSGNASQWYKPSSNCKMQYLGSPLCAVCKQTFTKKIHDLTQVIDQFSPTNTSTLQMVDSLRFSLDLIYPTPNTLHINWFLNGITLNASSDSIILQSADLNVGPNTLIAQVSDTTSLIRIDTHTTQIQTVQWTIDKTISGYDISANTSKKTIYLAPNPSDDFVMIEFKKEHPNPTKLVVRNITGKIILNKVIRTKMTGMVQYQMNILDLTAGMYYLFIKDNVQLISVPFIKK